MATPLGHALTGYVVYQFLQQGKEHNQNDLAMLSILMATVPDLDFVPGVLSNKPSQHHRGASHSLSFALASSLVVAIMFSEKKKTFWTVLGLSFISYVSHLIMDFFGPRKTPFSGIPLFWPVSKTLFLSPLPLFMGAYHAGRTASSSLEWFKSPFRKCNLAAIMIELLWIMPLFLLSQRKNGDGSQ
jgi:inner membrane protein